MTTTTTTAKTTGPTFAAGILLGFFPVIRQHARVCGGSAELVPDGIGETIIITTATGVQLRLRADSLFPEED